MGNIIGDPFDSGVRDQINLRQEKMGALNKDTDNIKWQNNTNAFLRLASSVNITGSALAEKFQIEEGNYDGDILAKNFMLFNGVTSIKSTEDGITPEDLSNPFQSGINTNGNILNKGAYGFGGLEMGYKPMPGLVSANVSFYNRGSLKTAEVQIKAFTPTQFDIIEVLYMRVGFTVLLEWGHNQYLDNNTQKLVTPDYFDSDPLSMLFSKKSNDNVDPEKLKEAGLGKEIDTSQVNSNQLNKVQQTNKVKRATTSEILKSIQKERKERSYNYDAMYGKIRSFSWTYNKDGTYDITINIISVGDVIESLNINKNFTLNSGVELITYKKELVKTVKDGKVVRADDVYLDSIKDNQGWLSSLHQYLWNVKTKLELIKTQYYIDLEEEGENKPKIEKALVKIPFLNEDVEGGINTQYYIKLGRLLRFIEDNLLYYGESLSDPIVGIDTSKDNFCLTYPQQFPANPKVCVIPVSYADKSTTPPINWEYLSKTNKGEELIGTSFKTKNRYIGNLLNIHVNIEYVLGVFDSSMGNKGDVNIYSFLQTLMDGISNSLGGVNSFSVTYNNETNKIVIREDNNLRYNKDNNEKPTTFVMHGFQTSKGSIIKNIDFNVQLTSQFATMVSIGAQSNGNQVGENATLLSGLYAGSLDRINEKKLDLAHYQTGESEFDGTIDLRKLNETLNATYFTAKEGKFIFQDTDDMDVFLGNIGSSNIRVLKSISQTYARFVTGELNKQAQIPALGFFPFDLQLTISGLSGMRVYEKFKTTEKILPSVYRDKDGNSKMDFLIKGINHTIQNNKWDTTLTTLTVPTEPKGKYLPLEIPTPPIKNNTVFTDKCGQTITFSRFREEPYVSSNSLKKLQVFAKLSYDRTYEMPNIGKGRGKGGEAPSLCARYVYNMARCFTKILSKGLQNPNNPQVAASIAKLQAKSTTEGLPPGTSANAKDQGFFTQLSKLGYEQLPVGENIDKDLTIQMINQIIPLIPGDIIVYYGKSGREQDGAVKYGHVQFYLGQKGEKSILNENDTTEWASSIKNNYGTEFVYRSKDISCWDLILFRNPGYKTKEEITAENEGIYFDENGEIVEVPFFFNTKFISKGNFDLVDGREYFLTPDGTVFTMVEGDKYTIKTLG